MPDNNFPVDNEEYIPGSQSLDNYTCTRNADGKTLEHGTYVVLRVIDPHARNAVRAYSQSVRPENEEFAKTMDEMVAAHEERLLATDSLRRVAEIAPELSADIEALIGKLGRH